MPRSSRSSRSPRALVLAAGLALAASCAPAGERVLRVGPKKELKVPSAAAAEARDGDVIEIDAGLYKGDVCIWRANSLTIRGVGGKARLEAAGRHAQGKAIWVVQGNDTTIEHVEFSGCRVPDRNGAGIRQEGRNLTVRHCLFRDNEDGILGGGGPESEILIEHTEFAHNGHGDGFSHNIYIGRVKRFTLRHSYSHHTRVGHNVKSRARENRILYNRIMDEADGNASRAIDLPDGGLSIVVGNVIQQGPKTENSTLLGYANEKGVNPDKRLFVAGNTFVSDRGRTAIFIHNAGKVPAIVTNNLLVGEGTVLKGPGRPSHNLKTRDAKLADRAGYDYRPTAASPGRDAGADPGKAGDFPLLPEWHYVHPAGREPRPAGDGKLDIGAYEFVPPEAPAPETP